MMTATIAYLPKGPKTALLLLTGVSDVLSGVFSVLFSVWCCEIQYLLWV
jgi:hypothetical protein